MGFIESSSKSTEGDLDVSRMFSRLEHPRQFTNIGIWVGLITSYLNILLNVCDDLVTNVTNNEDFDSEFRNNNQYDYTVA